MEVLAPKPPSSSTPMSPALSFEALCLPHRPALLNYALRFTKHKDTAEDLVQETYLKGLRFWKRFKPVTDDVSRDALMWLRRMQSNIFYNQHARTKRHSTVIEEYSHELPAPNEPPDLSEISETLDKLAPTYREAIALRYIQHQEFAEIAETLGVAETTVRTKIHKGLKELARLVNPSPVETSQTIQAQPNTIDGIMRRNDPSAFLDGQATPNSSPTR